jgi:hypothetical protein
MCACVTVTVCAQAAKVGQAPVGAGSSSSDGGGSSAVDGEALARHVTEATNNRLNLLQYAWMCVCVCLSVCRCVCANVCELGFCTLLGRPSTSCVTR